MQDWQNTVHTFEFLVSCSIVSRDAVKTDYKKGDKAEAPTYNNDPVGYNQFLRFEKNGIAKLVSSKLIKAETEEKEEKKEDKKEKKNNK